MKQLSKKEIKELNSKLVSYGIALDKKSNVRSSNGFYFENNEIKFFNFEGKIIPSLKLILSDEDVRSKLKTLSVDMGAVRFVVNGADIMRPGIPKFDKTLEKGEPVLVLDESHGKPLAIGIMVYSGIEMEENEAGKAVKNIHYVGDAIWKNDVSC